MSSPVLTSVLLPAFAVILHLLDCVHASVPLLNSSGCLSLPGDDSWPSHQDWTSLNASVGHRLIETSPIAKPCHDPYYDEARCSALKQSWVYAQTYFNAASGGVAPYFQNQSCDPFTLRSKPCANGNDPVYAMNVSSAQDVAAGLQFAQMNNVRVTVRNTGHDLLGRSTGKGSLSIWTHYLKTIDFLDYPSAAYNGPAMKLGAGVQSWEAYQAAEARGFRVLGGTCLTIGLVGGFTQAGGHSDLSSTYGLAADNVLEWEVVTANGTHLFASRTSHNNIYWALSGGGPGTYGVVLSMTVKVFPDGPVGGVSLAFTSVNVSQDKYWRAVSAFHASLLSWVEKGGSAAYTISNQSFYLQPATFPDLPSSEVHGIVQPLISNLTAENIAYSLNFTSSPTYLAHASHYYGPLPYGTYPSAQVQGGRLIPRSVVQDRSEEFRDVLQNVTSGGAFQIIGTALDVSQSVVGSGGADTAVLPAWRDALITLIAASAWDYTAPLPQNTAHEQQITGIVDPSLQRVTGPDSGVYMNEGNFQQPGFRKQFYGPNYSKLRQIKKEYDPQDLFYVTAGVGSEAWRVAADGRLCRAA